MRASIFIFSLILNLFYTGYLTAAQADDPTVPDLSGLNAPQAAAVLRLEGFALGNLDWDFSTSTETNTVIGQQPAAGTVLEMGGAVSITVAQTPNIRLIYDDNDLTMINTSGSAIDLTGLLLVREEDRRALPGERWPLAVWPNGGCLQIWSVARSVSKPVAGCQDITAWFSSSVSEIHVWTPLAETGTFSLSIAGETVANCQTAVPSDAASPRLCEGYVTPSPDPAVARYLYFSYTLDTLMVKNPSSDLWMPLNTTLIAGGESVDLGTSALYNAVIPVALDETNQRIRSLAPGECVVLFSAEDAPLPEACALVVAEATDINFWTDGFRLGGDGASRACPAASDERLTLCILQR